MNNIDRIFHFIIYFLAYTNYTYENFEDEIFILVHNVL
jgi:hypothetical protein